MSKEITIPAPKVNAGDKVFAKRCGSDQWETGSVREAIYVMTAYVPSTGRDPIKSWQFTVWLDRRRNKEGSYRLENLGDEDIKLAKDQNG